MPATNTEVTGLLLKWGQGDESALDRLIPLAAARELIRRRPDWTLEILEGVGHVPMMESPQEFMRALNGWSAYRIAREPAAIS